MLRFTEIYPQTIISINKGTKSGILENYPPEKISQEFNYLKQNIDYDKEHLERLIPNNNLNRYSNIRPYKDNVVSINSENKYINASWIHLPYNNIFIGTQGPLDTTIDDFWEMCYSYKVKVIVMLCKLQENNKIKCAKYWDSNNVKKFILKQINSEFDLIDGVIVRNFEIKKNQNDFFPNTVIQLHYTCWDDHSTPDVDSYNKLIKLIEFLDYYKDNSPVVVHCSAGVGRSGTFIALYNLYHNILRQIKDNQINEIKFSIMDLVRKLKEMRTHSVENEGQYKFIYQFVNILLNENN